jgi:hypothetical protein
MDIPTRPPDPARTARERQTLIIHDYDLNRGQWRWTGFEPDQYRYVEFGPGATMDDMNSRFWRQFRSMRSVIVPPSVQTIDGYCFCTPDGFSPLETITFAPGSQLREIAGAAFLGCDDLKFISLPASVEKLDGESFHYCGIRDIELEVGNRHFVWRRPCLMDVRETVLIRCFGANRGGEMQIPDHIERIGRYCFHGLHCFGPVVFGADSKCLAIEERAFACCQFLNRIRVPAGVISIGEYCFSRCAHLVDAFLFSADSTLTDIQANAFGSCAQLASITIPATVEAIGDQCFSACRALADIDFERDSKLKRIGNWAFEGCVSLEWFDVPSSVEFVGLDCFYGCSALTEFVFLSPPHVRELLGVVVIGRRIEIPDSVEALAMPKLARRDATFALEFGRESRLVEIRRRKRLPGDFPRRGFLRVPSRSLKVVRAELEFEDREDQERRF